MADIEPCFVVELWRYDNDDSGADDFLLPFAREEFGAYPSKEQIKCCIVKHNADRARVFKEYGITT